MLKERLFTPGPTTIPLRIMQAMQVPSLHHRTDPFKKVIRESLDGMRWLLELDADPVFITGSGTAGMEACLVNLCVPGDKIIAVNAGSFGERWLHIASRAGLGVVEIRAEWGQSPGTAEIRAAVSANRDAKLFCFQLCETSAATLLPMEEIIATVKSEAPEMLVVVDAISSIATLPIHPRKQSIDVLVAAAHKGLMLPPGIAILDLSERAWKAAESTKKQSLYFDLLMEREWEAKGTTTWTPATTLFLGLNEAIAMLREEGLASVYARHNRMAKAARAGLRALGLELLSKHPAPGVTAAFPPAGIAADDIRKVALDRLGVRLAGGQGHMKGKIFRIGHLGYCDDLDVIDALTAVELSLRDLGHDLELGSAVRAALEVISSEGR